MEFNLRFRCEKPINFTCIFSFPTCKWLMDAFSYKLSDLWFFSVIFILDVVFTMPMNRCAQFTAVYIVHDQVHGTQPVIWIGNNIFLWKSRAHMFTPFIRPDCNAIAKKKWFGETNRENGEVGGVGECGVWCLERDEWTDSV